MLWGGRSSGVPRGTLGQLPGLQVGVPLVGLSGGVGFAHLLQAKGVWRGV